jgi:hypothetical protein
LKVNYALVSAFSATVILVLISVWLSLSTPLSYSVLNTVLTTTTAVFGTLLGIITAGLMFTQGTFSELTSELTEKAPTYIADVLSMEKIQTIQAKILALRKTFNKLEESTDVAEERNLYEGIVAKASSMFVDFAVLLNLKLKQQGLPIAHLLVSEMDPKLYRVYMDRLGSIKKEWQVFEFIKRITNTWEAQAASFIDESNATSALEADLKSSMAIFELKEKIDKSLVDVHNEVAETFRDLSDEIAGISKRVHKDRIPQLLSQMRQASAIRGRYFYLALIFIVAPLLFNLLIIQELSESTVAVFQPMIAITGVLSIMGVIFLLLYIYEILSV